MNKTNFCLTNDQIRDYINNYPENSKQFIQGVYHIANHYLTRIADNLDEYDKEDLVQKSVADLYEYSLLKNKYDASRGMQKVSFVRMILWQKIGQNVKRFDKKRKKGFSLSRHVL